MALKSVTPVCCDTFTGRSVPQQPDDFSGERARARREGNIETGPGLKTFRGQRGGDDATGRSPRFQNLDSGAAAGTERGDHDLSLSDLRPGVRDGPGDLYSGPVGGAGR